MNRWAELAKEALELEIGTPRHPVDDQPAFERWFGGVKALLALLVSADGVVPELRPLLGVEATRLLVTGRDTLERRGRYYGADSREPCAAALRDIRQVLNRLGDPRAAAATPSSQPLAPRLLEPSPPNPEFEQAEQSALAAGWILLERLGEGGGGITYLAVRASAVEVLSSYPKIARGSASRDETSRYVTELRKLIDPEADSLAVFKSAKRADARMKREIKALASLRHQNLVRIFSADPSESPSWYLMEYFKRGDLTHSWKEFAGKGKEVLQRTRELATAVAAVHAADLVHRDVKPDNIFIGDDGRWVLADFGIAFANGGTRHTEHGPAPMTKEWRPDWVVSRRLDEYTPAVDIFLLAKVAYAMIAGPGKNPPATQLNRKEFDLRSLHPTMESVGAVQKFLTDHIVTDEDSIASTTVDQFVAKLDSLIASFDKTQKSTQVISFLASHSLTWVETKSLHVLREIPLRLPDGTTMLRCEARLLATAGNLTPSMKLVLRVNGGVLSSRSFDFALHPADETLGHWVTMELPIPEKASSGSFSLSVEALPGGVAITGLIAHAESR